MKKKSDFPNEYFQIALTALVFASVKTTVNIDEYILKNVYGSLESHQMQKIKETIKCNFFLLK